MTRIWSTAGLLLGLAGVGLLLAFQGYAAVADDLAALGGNVLLLPLAFLPSLILSAAAWRLLFPPNRQPAFVTAARALWIAMSVNTVLPAAGIGGEVAKIRVLMQSGTRGTDAAASIVLGKTVDAVALILWALLGLGIAVLVAAEGGGALLEGLFWTMVALTFGVAGFVYVQHAGPCAFLVRRLNKRRTDRPAGGLEDNAADLDGTIRGLYRERRRLALATAFRLLSRVVQSGEIWLAIALMGDAVSPWDAVILTSLTSAMRGAAFFIPGGWGVQEGGFVVVGALIGLPADFMLALALATRAREMLVSVPGMLAWQLGEGHDLWKRRAVAMRR